MHSEDELLTWLELHLDVRQQLNDEVNCVCPYHQTSGTRKPDMWVNVTKGVYHCLSSSCGAKGSAHTLVADIEGCTPAEAQRQLGRPSTETLHKMLEQLHLFEPPEASALTWEQIAQYSQPHSFWDNRGITPTVREWFALGFDYEREAATIPYLDENGEPHSMIRRFVNPIDGMKYHYPHGFIKDEAIFNFHAIVPQWETIVVEGSIDCIKTVQNLQELGLQYNVVALFGSHASKMQLRKLRHLSIILMFDPDPAGKTGQEDFQKNFPRICQRVIWPHPHNDPGTLTAQVLKQRLLTTTYDFK